MDEIFESDRVNKTKASFPVIGIGASAGGLDAFSQLVRDLKINSGAAYVLIQHLSPSVDSQLRSILSRLTLIPISEIKDNTLIESNHIYISPPGSSIIIKDGAFMLNAFLGNTHPKTIDVFFKSLAMFGPQVAGIILSGTGSDGTKGLRAIKENGGITIAQVPETAQFPEMPNSAISAGVIDYVLSISEISNNLPEIIHKLVNAKNKLDEEEYFNLTFKDVFTILRNRFKVDFTPYCKPTIKRRIKKRMTLHKIKTLEKYISMLRDDEAEVEALYDDLLINVTSFFRDPQSFEALSKEALPQLLEGRTSDDTMRVWVPGCSTGQESYSLAILILEYLEEKKLNIKVTIFATDIDDDAINIARVGLYSEEIYKTLSPERLKKFFVKQPDGYKVCKRVRDLCVFSRHDLISDPPFAHLDMISCRNLLIYIENMQRKLILQDFHYALVSKGILFLGVSESINESPNLFTIIDKKHKIFMKKVSFTRPTLHFLKKSAPQMVGIDTPKKLAGINFLNAVQLKANEIVLNEYTPAGVIVDEDLEILQFRGETGRFLNPSPGVPSFNLIKMIRGSLSMKLHIAFEKAKQNNMPVAERIILEDVNGSSRIIGFEVRPFKIQQSTERFYLILFTDLGEHDSAKIAKRDISQEPLNLIDDYNAVKLELVETQKYLKANLEEKEAMAEGFKSTYEELETSYEELQSLTEELETAKEQLQTSNEEMSTLNEELENRNITLAQLNDDLNNLISSSQIPIVIIDGNMRIRMVTPLAERLGVLHDNVGRLITDLNLCIENPNVSQMVSEALKDLRENEMEMKDRDGHWFILRINLYRTVNNRIDGCVLSMIDVNDLKLSQLKALDAQIYAETLLETLRNPFVILDPDLSVVSANRAFYHIFNLQPSEVTNKLVYELNDHQWDIPELRLLLEQILPKKSSFEDFEVDHVFPGLGRRVMLLNGRQVFQKLIGRNLILLEFEDITEHIRTRANADNLESLLKQRTNELIEAEQLAAAGKVAAMLGHDLRNPIQTIKNSIYLLRESPGETEERLKDIDDVANRMITMVEELRANIRNPPFTPQKVDLGDFIGRCLKDASIPPGVTTHLIVGAGLKSVTLDPFAMQRVLDNLVRNAFEAMPRGGDLSVSAEVVGSDAVINVSDTGVGIPEEMRAKLFKAFNTSKSGGLGLGLAYCKRAVEAHGGIITVESNVDEGTTVMVKLPL
jgi:two-component system CheB/CheR fusion protein